MSRSITCWSCGNESDGTTLNCPSCGASLRSRPRRTSAVLGAAIIALIVLVASLAAALVAALDENGRLRDENEGFMTTKEELEDEVSDLQSNNTSLQAQLSLLQDEIIYLESVVASLEGNTSDLEDELFEWWHIFRMRTGMYPQDLVTPDNPEVEGMSALILGTDADGDLTWDDMAAINEWVHNNIAYSNDPYITSPHNDHQHDYWQTPAETLDRGEGDCEDLANLALSLMLAEEDVPWLWAARVVFVGGGGHVGIFVNVENDEMSVLDPTWGWMSPTNRPEIFALDEWAGQDGHAGVSWVVMAYTSIGVEDFDSLQQFIEWF